MARTRKLTNFAAVVICRAALPGIIAGVLYLGATSVAHAASGDGPVAGAIIDEFDALYGNTTDVIITTACLQGNPFVPSQPPSTLAGTPTLSGCKLDIPVGGGSPDDNTQLITVLPSNFTDSASVYTFGTGSTTALEFGVTVDAMSKDIFVGLANPGLFDDPPIPFVGPDVAVASTADAFCTSVNGTFVCAKIEPCPDPDNCPSTPSCGALSVNSGASQFCSNLTGLLEGAYNLQRNPLAYAISTNMSQLAQSGSVTLRLCPGFRAQCLPPGASPVASDVQVTTLHTQRAFVETPRILVPYR